MPKGTRLTGEQKDGIVELRRDGIKNRVVAERLGVGVNSIIRVLHERAPDLVAEDRRRVVNTGDRLYAGHEAEEYTRKWTGRGAPPVREQRALEGSSIRPLTQREITGRR